MLIYCMFNNINPLFSVETQSAADSPWSVMLEGWVDEPGKGNSGHDHDEEHLSHGEDHDEQGKHGNKGKGKYKLFQYRYIVSLMI